jgi:glutamate synthase (NADPH/NADH) large chain
LVNFFNFLAEDVREHLAAMGFRSLNEIVGHADLIVPKSYTINEKVKKIDISKIIHLPEEAKNNAVRCVKKQNHKNQDIQDRE